MNERERDKLTRLREAFSSGSWEPAAEDCPDSGTLWTSAAGRLDPVENEAVLLHVARCGQCASIWRLAREMSLPAETKNGSAAPLETVGRTRVWRRPAFLAAAATVLIGLGLATGVLMEHRDVAPPPVERRQQAALRIEASPATNTLSRSRCRLRWSAGPAGTRYDLAVTGEDLVVLAVVKALTVPEYVLPAEKIPGTTREILWRVTAHLPGGGIVRSRTFRSRVVD